MAARKSGLGRGLDSLIPEVKPLKKEDPKDKPAKKKTQSASAAAKQAAPEEKAPEKQAAKQAVPEKKAAEKQTAKKPAPEKKLAEKQTAKKPAPEKKAAEKQTAKKPAPEKKAPDKQTAENAAAEKKAPENAAAPAAEIAVPVSEEARGGVMMLRISSVEPNREQPRKDFDEDRLAELAESIREHGVIQPLLVQKAGKHYEIIAGERRWRAAKQAGLKEIPAIVREYSKQEAVEVSLIENIQREDLNPIEEAQAYDRLMKEFDLKQEDIAKRVSRSRAAVANAVRLLNLPAEVRDMVTEGILSEGHARTLLPLPEEALITAAKYVAAKGLSVRETEKYVKSLLAPRRRTEKETDPVAELIVRDIEKQMREALGAKVEIRTAGKHSGRIEITYSSDDELERLLYLIRRSGGEA